MKILFTTNKAHLPQRHGGSESSTNELTKLLRKNGHDARVMSRLVPEGITYFINRITKFLTQRQFPADYVLGYPTYRDWGKGEDASHGLQYVTRRFKPDVVVIQAGRPLSIAKQSCNLGIPTVVYLRDVEFNELGGNPNDFANIGYISNSNFTANRFKECFGISSLVIPPIVSPSNYYVQSSRSKVLYINPNPKKGLHIVLELAKARPDIEFLIQESWILSNELRTSLIKARESCRNIELREPDADMRNSYKEARLVLAPSQWEEAWGRIATEAQISGIPVISSDRGGLPESVGDGGIIVKHDAKINEWMDALSTLWDNNEEYTRYAEAALKRSKRLEIDNDFLVNKLITFLYHQSKLNR